MVFNSQIENLVHSNIDVDIREVETAFKKVKQSGGIPYPHTWIYKRFAHIFTISLQKIINASFNLGYIPYIIKYTNITPIPKIAKPLSPNDFKPINACSPILKIMEKFVSLKWFRNMISENIFHDQFS